MDTGSGVHEGEMFPSRKKRMGLYSEKQFKVWTSAAVLLVFFAIVYLPWLMPVRELFRQEGLFAAEAFEFHRTLPVVTAHNVVVRNAYPLFPALAALLTRSCGVPMESALRGISFLFLLAGAVLVFFSAAKERSPRAGTVAAAVYLSTMVALEKAVDGTPATANAFWLLAAQMVFFYFGVRKAEWNRAWLGSALLVLVGFFTGGPTVLLFFVFPMFFFRRPLSVKSKFRHIGFIAAAALVATAAAGWGLLVWVLAGRTLEGGVWLSNFSLSEYLKNMLEFPLMLPLRMLPWSLIGWIPFCVALQAIDPKPIFSRYLRTLFFASLALLWLLPETDSHESLYLPGAFAVLCGIYYEPGMRRYGVKLRKFLGAGEYFTLLVVVAVGVVCVAPIQWLTPFFSLNRSLGFRDSLAFVLTATAGAVGISLLSAWAYRHRTATPVWIRLLLISLAAGFFYSFVMLPYRAQDSGKRRLGRDIETALRRDHAEGPLFKVDISDLYGPLFYSGATVVKLPDLSRLPEHSERVYLISTEFPAYPARNWSNLLPPDYTYMNRKLMLWKGVPAPVRTTRP